MIEADVFDGVVAIVSEFVSGGSLAEELSRHNGGQVHARQAVELTVGILSGLEYLHSRDVIHRDLKPANILLQQGIPRLTDFGLSRDPAELTSSGLVAGTPSYMAPEAFDGERSIQTDLWSVGVLLFQMLTGKLPFQESRLTRLIQALGDDRPVEIPAEIPALLSSVVSCALSKHPADRYRCAAEMRAALAECRRQLSLSAADGRSPRYLTVAIAGSMAADPDRVRDRLESLLRPYLSPLTTWYTGTYGTVDHVAIEYLAGESQQVYLVGYDDTDISHATQQLLEEFDLPFIDAQVESVPPVDDAPSRRDVYFTSKSDLVILIWDGKSPGTKQLHNWLMQQGRDHVMVYV
jgi:serine/threonine protein kinase